MSNRTIEQNLTLLSSTKKNIRNAINIKGGSVSSATPFADYATAISNLPSGGGGTDLDWSLIGYSARPSTIDDGYAYARVIYLDWDSTQTSLSNKFANDKELVYMPFVDTSNANNMFNMFIGCSRLEYVPLMDTSSVTGMSQMFYKCSSLTTIPQLDTSKVITMESMFRDCTSLISAPQFNTSACTSMQYMFQGCSGLTTVPQFNTSACTKMEYMFASCSGLTTVPQFNTDNVEDMSYMFMNCAGLTSVPQFNTSACTKMSNMFSNCSSLKTVPQFNTSACTTMNSMLSSCPLLEKIEGLDFASATNVNLFAYTTVSNLKYALFKNLGTPSNMTSYDFARATNWGVADSTYTDARQSLVDSLLTYSFDRATAGYSTCTIKLSTNSKNELTAQEISDIEAKGYTITT